MTIEETRKIVLSFFENDRKALIHNYDKKLIFNGHSFQIRPDDAFYFPNKVIIVEYENNLRPVESISKYFWLFTKTEWRKEKLKIYLLLTINNSRLENNYKIRTESIQILGDELKKQYPDLFDFSFLNYSDLNKDKLVSELTKMTNK
jgi:hypothetical protein